MDIAALKNRLDLYEKLMRLDKPIGILLLLWPTLWGLWIASEGQPSWIMVFIFAMGTVLMRSAGCVMNDMADAKFDAHVERTRERPLAAGKLSRKEAGLLAFFLVVCAFVLITPLNRLTMLMSIPALLLAATYPFTKRFLAVPQAYLGIAFGFGIPMAFAATWGRVPTLAWVLLLANVFWAIAYDTAYAMVDREDDVKIGIRTSAITFGRYDVLAIVACYAIMLAILIGVGIRLRLLWPYYAGLAVAAALMVYLFSLVRTRDRARCFKAFLHNNWIGAAIFAGIVGHYLVFEPLVQFQ
jgi:4-hydroxybenzoate polyprenyltransferase